ncbi:hypothetical protein D3C73_841300 [compost metagenome]
MIRIRKPAGVSLNGAVLKQLGPLRFDRAAFIFDKLWSIIRLIERNADQPKVQQFTAVGIHKRLRICTNRDYGGGDALSYVLGVGNSYSFRMLLCRQRGDIGFN